MSGQISIEDAQAKLGEIIAQLQLGEEVVITDRQQPVAKLVGQRPPHRQRPGPGLCRGMITIVADDDEHLRDFAEYMP
jgi:prevent-host-death family protein